MSIVSEYLNFLNEGYTQSTIRRGRQQKIKSTSATVAVSLARKRNDPLYQRMIRYKKLARLARQQMERKYKAQSMTKARELASKPR